MAAPAFVGIATLDVIQRVREPPQWGRKSVADSVEFAAGGPATNAAVTCARLYGTAALITGIGLGAAADVVRADLRAHQVEVYDCAPADRSWSMPVASAIVHPDGERTVVSTGALPGDPAGVDLALHAKASSILRAASVVMFDGHHAGLAQAALDASPSTQLTVLDAGSAKPHAERWLPRIDVLAASADYAAGLGLTTEQVLTHGLDAGCRAVVVTDGAGPAHWACAAGGSGATVEFGTAVEFRTAVNSGTVQPAQVRARDTLAAGDAFHGALVAELATAGPRWADRFERAVQRAVRVATVRVRHIGARTWLEHL